MLFRRLSSCVLSTRNIKLKNIIKSLKNKIISRTIRKSTDYIIMQLGQKVKNVINKFGDDDFPYFILTEFVTYKEKYSMT